MFSRDFLSISDSMAGRCTTEKSNTLSSGCEGTKAPERIMDNEYVTVVLDQGPCSLWALISASVSRCCKKVWRERASERLNMD